MEVKNLSSKKILKLLQAIRNLSIKKQEYVLLKNKKNMKINRLIEKIKEEIKINQIPIFNTKYILRNHKVKK